MPQAPSPPTAQESPGKEPLDYPITTMELPPQHRTTPDRNGVRDLPRQWAIHNSTLRSDKITPGFQAIRLHSITEPTTTWTLPTDRHRLLLTVQGDATITPIGGTPHNSSPRPRRPHTPASIIATYDGGPGPHHMASHRHHLPRPQRPQTHRAATVGGHPWGPRPGTPRAYTHPPHHPPGTRSGPSTTQHTHPRIMGVPLRAHLDQVPLSYPSETVVQPSSTAHFHYGFPTVEPLSRYSNKLLSSNLKTAIFQPCKR